MIDWLNDNSGAVQAVSVVILAVVTGIYAWRTWSISNATEKQVEASRKMAEGVLRPVIVQWLDRAVSNKSKGHVLLQRAVPEYWQRAVT